ncbi:MAG TPA: neutral/alkaline non-lysosomal ceramidase N-terminal domain-containing protein [Thermoguttaceae bacterium]|nr:neutral/alkaline non-lysosomal ceramidase N-terminal domain-containing protein [Thermoguttaceae bacterium]
MRSSRLIFCLAISIACSLAHLGRAAELRAGVARMDLTPPAELNAALGGYGERMSRPAEGVHDRVFAKTLVISDGAKRFALVTADVLGFPPGFKTALVERLADAGWTADRILLLPSHSHTSIDLNAINPRNVFGVPQIGVYQPELFELVVERLAEVVRRAERELAAVVVGTSSRELPDWTRNRRHDDGPTDPELTVTRIDTADGKPLAVLFHFTAHPTIMGPEHMLFSGGWPGHAQRTLEALVGEDATAMFYNGAQGDQRPAARPDSGPSRWETAERYGRELAIEAWRQWQAIEPRADVAFDDHLQTIKLPQRRIWHPDFLETGGEEYGLSEALLSKALPLLFPAETGSVSLRLGDLVIVGAPGELIAELGLRVQREAAEITGARHVVVGGLADEWISYILSEAEYRQGGYEASVSFYGPTLGETIVTGMLEGARHLKSSREAASK